MRRVLGALLPIALLAACAGQPEQAWQKTRESMEKANGSAEKGRLAAEFLERHPASEQAPDAAQAAAYYLVDADRAAEAEALLGRMAERAGEKNRRAIQFTRAEVLGDLGRSEELRTLAAELVSAQAPSYNENRSLVDAGIETGAWDLAAERAAAAASQATAEAYREENPKADDDRVKRTVRRRRAFALSAEGWALANLGREDEALARFDDAAEFDNRTWVGASESDLGLYRGRTLLRAGRTDEAIEVLTPEALFGGGEGALEALREAWAVKQGSADGFEDFLWERRNALAPTIGDFTLPDYEGVKHSFSALRNGEVTLLAFWFPT